MEAELQHRIQSFLTPEPMSRQDSVASSAYSYYDHPTTVKMEDLQTSPQSMADIPTPRPSGEHSRQQPKKRKSWGQVLPEPKTSLPPRKRAKTADEKEQRRIERVKRNRLAAHNSRERKRQEYDVLLQEKEELEIKLESFEQAMKDMAAELQAYRSMAHGQAPSASGLGITNVALPTTGISSYMNMNNNVVNPQRSFSSQSFPSPESMRSIDSVESPMNTITQPTTPEPSSEPDQTQHSAVSVGFQDFAMGGDKTYTKPAPLNLSVGDVHSLPLQSAHLRDDAHLDTLFDFSSFDNEPSTNTFFESSFHTEPISPLDIGAGFDARPHGLQADFGATSFVSDGSGIAA